jgi:hypothetical protein
LVFFFYHSRRIKPAPSLEEYVRKSLATCIVFLSVVAANAAPGGKIETLGGFTDSSVSEAVKKAIDSKGYRIILDDDSVLCEIWLRKNVPEQAKKDTSGALYSQLAESTLVGVISFSQATTDYRGQAIKVGTYTLRYELMPNDGNHLGVAPNRDFLLLVPAASDADPDAAFKFDELLNLSRKATGTRHPGPLSLVQGEAAAPAVSKDDEDHWIFSAGVKLASGGELPFALVVKGTAPQ